MAPDQRDLDEELRGHLALSIQERIDRGDDPDTARRNALRELGYVPAIRESMRQVWYSPAFDAVAAIGHDMQVALRSLRRARMTALTVILTLALGIGANTAIVSVVREVLYRPLVNRDQHRLIYIRQSAPDQGAENLTFSVPEVADLRARTTAFSALGEFSTVDLTLVGIGEPRVIRAGVVNGEYFEVMGLQPVLGRLLTPSDDRPDAAQVAVLTHRFWAEQMGRDPDVVGRTIQLGSGDTTVIGVLEPSIPYPADTELIANVVTSPHHLSATMELQRTHRMTELFGRLAPGVDLETARADLQAAHAGMLRDYPATYLAGSDIRVSATTLREQLGAPARPALLLLLAAATLVFVIACSNVANLLLTRSIHRETEWSVRAALGASRAALRRTLLAESLVLCGAGAGVGVALAYGAMPLVRSFAAQFSVRARDARVDGDLLWLGVGLAFGAAVALAFIPRLSPGPKHGAGANTRLRMFATAQVALSFVLVSAAGVLITTLGALQSAQSGVDLRVLALDIPPAATGVWGAPVIEFVEETTRRVAALPGVQAVAAGSFVPWRDAGDFGPGFAFAVDAAAPSTVDLRGRLRIVAPGFFDVLGIPIQAGRDFTTADRADTAPVIIVSRSLAERVFPDGHALNKHLWWTDPYFGPPVQRRIIGIVADVDDERLLGEPALTVYHPIRQMGYASRLFVRASVDPYTLIVPVTDVVRAISASQPVERASTLQDIRAEVLAPQRTNTVVFSAFAGVALLISVVGVASVLAFSVSARTREFGVRLAIGSTPRQLLFGVLTQGTLIAVGGIGTGGAVGLAALAAWSPAQLPVTDVGPVLGAAALLAGAAILASLIPAARAARVNVIQALRSE